MIPRPPPPRRLRLARVVANAADAVNRLKKLLTIANSAEAAEAAARYLLACDPTPRKKYVPWLAKLANAGKIDLSDAAGRFGVAEAPDAQLILPEDRPKVLEALSLLERFRASPALRGVNVMDLDWRGLVDAIDKLRGDKPRADVAPAALPGARVVLETGPWKVFQVPKLDGGPDDPAKVQALQTLGLGTKWCTRGDYPEPQAENYLSRSAVYVVLKGGRKLAQFSMDAPNQPLQLKDAMDRDVDPAKEPELARVIVEILGEAEELNPETAAKVAVAVSPGRDPDLEWMMLQAKPSSNGAWQLCRYWEKHFPRGERWPEAEPALAADPHVAGEYHERIGARIPWPAGEAAIAADAETASWWARDVLRERWPPGEAAIAKDPDFAVEYAQAYFPGQRWPEAEPAISKHPPAAARYAVFVLKGRWPEAEPAIARDAYAATLYANRILGRRWPAAEPAILKDVDDALGYFRAHFRGPWPELEAAIEAQAPRSRGWYRSTLEENEHRARAGDAAPEPFVAEPPAPPAAKPRRRGWWGLGRSGAGSRRERLAAVVANADEAANRLKKLLRVNPRDLLLRVEPDGFTVGGPGGRPLDVRDTLAGDLLRCDPTPRGKYVPWLAKVFNAGGVLFPRLYEPSPTAGAAQFILPEDRAKVWEALSLLERFRTAPALRGVNVMTLDWHGVEDAAERLKAASDKPDLVPASLPGATVVHDDGTYKVFKVAAIDLDGHDPDDPETVRRPEETAAVEALKRLGMGTKWCTRGDYENCYAASYLSRSPVFVVHKGGRPHVQFHLDPNHGEISAMDSRDRPFDFDAEPALKPIVYAALAADQDPDGDSTWTRVWLCELLRHRDPAVERKLLDFDGVAVDADGPRYVEHVIRGRWPELDRAIAARPDFAARHGQFLRWYEDFARRADGAGRPAER